MNAYHSLLLGSLSAHALSAILFVLSFPQGRRSDSRLNRLAIIMFSLGALGLALLLGATYTCYFGQDCSNAPISALLLGLSLSLLLIVAHGYYGMKHLGAFVAPIVTLLPLLELLITPKAGHMGPAPTGGFLYFHIIMAVVSEAFAIIACAVSLLYLIQQSLIKSKQLAKVQGLGPPLYLIDKVLFGSLWLGFGFMTVALVSGAAQVVLFKVDSSQNYELKVIWSVATWTWYLAILLAKNIFNAPAKRIAYMCVLGFALLAASLFGLYPLERVL